MEKIQFTVPGEPVGKARPRVKRNGYTYTPKKSKDYENLVKQCCIISCPERKAGYSENIGVVIKAYFGIAKSDSKSKKARKASGALRPTKKPDSDNITKAILDALNGVAYLDDSHVVELKVEKWFSEEPRVEVKVEYLGGEMSAG